MTRPFPLRFALLLTALFLAVASLGWGETLPARPARYFNDYAGVVGRNVASELNRELADYERSSSNQLLVAIYPTMESASSIEDYTVRVAHAWQVGQKGRDNGAVLFVFVREHKLYLQVGYGLEPVLTDATSSVIINQEIRPRLRANDFNGAMRAGVHAMIAASQGEYHGTGRTQAEQDARSGNGSSGLAIVFFVIIMVVSGIFRNRSRSRVWGGSGRNWPPTHTGFGGGGWMGGFGGGGGSSGRNDSFSGGGGGFGGGGAGGSW